ncbi:hypothetical protein [Salinibaculum rarum]|uniref:DUF7836 family putative zinc-binding protein n=1 Tax=Salinibaculum rarum TaxID=3058903 RepID=UPI00265F3C8B|nr:hypothetical protein [Salinibaculum sp. KK48]
MNEAFVQLSCPACDKQWEDEPTALHAPDTDFTCPDCGESRHPSEFMRTDRDLEVLKDFTES